MRNSVLLIVLSVVLLCAGRPAFADTAEDLTEDFIIAGAPERESPAQSNFHGMLGAGLFNYEKISGDDGRRTALLPIVIVTYKDIAYWTLGGGGVWLLQTDDHRLRFGLGIRLHRGWKADDDARLAGIKDRDGSIDGYANVLWKTSVLNVGAAYYHDIGHVSNGDSAGVRFSHNFWFDRKFRLTPSLGAGWQNAKLVNYYYGVSADESSAALPVYVGKETVNVSAGLSGLYRLNSDWSLLGGLYAIKLGSGIADSPLVTRDVSTLAFLGVGWVF
jgi:outer membrane scaffolding protein for murein synthesis (MipA/OmpV family)